MEVIPRVGRDRKLPGTRESVSEVLFFAGLVKIRIARHRLAAWLHAIAASRLEAGPIAIGSRESGIFRIWARLKRGSRKDDGDRWFEVGPGLPEFLARAEGDFVWDNRPQGASVSESPLNSPASNPFG